MKFALCVLLLATAIFQAMAVSLPGPGQASIMDFAKRDPGHVLAKRDGGSLAYVSSDGTFTIFDPTPGECLPLGSGSTNISNNTDSDTELFEDGNCLSESHIDMVPSHGTVTPNKVAKSAMVLPK